MALVMALCLGCLLQLSGAESFALDLRTSSALQVNQVLRNLYARGDMVQLKVIAEQVVQQNNTEGINYITRLLLSKGWMPGYP